MLYKDGKVHDWAPTANALANGIWTTHLGGAGSSQGGEMQSLKNENQLFDKGGCRGILEIEECC
jgi:hypothetical protein